MHRGKGTINCNSASDRGGTCLKKILLLHMIKCGLVDGGAQKIILRGSGSLCQSKEVLVEMDREVVLLHYNHQVFLHWVQLLHLCVVMDWELIVDKGLYNFVDIVLFNKFIRTAVIQLWLIA